MAPDGSGDTSLFTLDEHYEAVAPHPTNNEFIFAYTAILDNPSTEPYESRYAIYRNSVPNIAGATALTSPTYPLIGTLQYTANGQMIIFTAAVNVWRCFEWGR